MEDKLHQFFNDNDFDVFEPRLGHLERFEKKLQVNKKKNKPTFFWMGIAASILLMLGFFIGNYQQQTIDLADVSPKMAEAQSFFVATINQELKDIEQYRTVETEVIIEKSLTKIEELEDSYKTLINDLSENENKRLIISQMIQNYQQRLNVLEKLLLQLEIQKNPSKLEIKEYEII